jgi:hypothetical protein
MPADLKRLLDRAAVERGQSLAQVVIAACWQSLEGAPQPAEHPVPASQLPARPAINMDALRVICAGQSEAEEPEPVEMCPYREWDGEVGEWFGCRLPAHGPKVKHQRGPVR